MRCAQDFMREIPVLRLDDPVTKARKILRDEGFRELYITDSKKNLAGYIDLTDALRITATKSNVTVEGFIKEPARAGPDDSVEDVAKMMRQFRTDSAVIVDSKGHVIGGVLLSDLFPVIICRSELRGIVRDVMTGKVVTTTPEDPIQKVYSLIMESGFSAFPVVKKNRVVGIVSRRDLISSHRIRTAIAQHAHTAIEEVMSKDVITSTPDDLISTAAERMVARDVSRLPVLDGDRLTGIVDRHDILKVMA